jgi:amidase
MRLDEYVMHDATGLADLVRRGDVTPAELAGLAAAGVAAVNPQLNAVLEVFADRVDTLDAGSLGNGPFRGVPFFVKDLGPRFAGRRQEAGSRLMQGYVADYTSFVAAQMERAGLNVMGRTPCPEFGVTGTTESILNGATRNPWNPALIAGGSSGGSAAITAAGVVPMAHSNDGAGSTRIPASICGNVGMKHSRGRISYAPEGCDLSFPLFSEGVNARTVRDLAGFLDAVMGPAPGEPIPWARPERPYTEEARREPGRLRIAVCADGWGPFTFAPHLRDQIRSVADALAGAGHHVEEAAPDLDFDAYLHTFQRIWVIDIAAMLDAEAAALGRPLSEETLEPMTLRMYEAGRDATAAERLGVSAALSGFGRALGAFHEAWDVLLTPTMGADTPPIGGPFNLVQPGHDFEDWWQHLCHLVPVTPLNNLVGTPALSLPLCEDAGGHPFGAHFMAAMGREDLLFRLAGQLEQLLPWAHRRPPVHVTSA